MGRQESLTALALGRGHYDDEVIREAGENSRGGQQYNDRGYPKNSETKRREREHVRAANEVMQVTGVVEDAVAARAKAEEYAAAKSYETFVGLRVMDVCRATFIAGTWGVIGLRWRVLLYRPYSDLIALDILQHERYRWSASHIAFAGLPATLTHHALEWISVLINAILDALLEDGDSLAKLDEKPNTALQNCLDIGFRYVEFHLQIFATLQQLNLIPASRILPSLKSFVLFSSESPFQIPPNPSLSRSWALELLQAAMPFIVIAVYNRAWRRISHLVYRPIYKSVPRPIAAVMVPEDDPTPSLEIYDASVGDTERERADYDEPTLRALEGLPTTENNESRPDRNDSSDEEDELAHATLISFDVEPTEGIESAAGPWSAELRSANEQKPSDGVRYRVTALTMLPAVMATEVSRDIVTGILMMPLEALMVRRLAKAFRRSAGLGIVDLMPVEAVSFPVMNLMSAVGMQVVLSGVIWAGFTIGSQAWVHRVSVKKWVGEKLEGYRSYWKKSGQH